MMLYRYEIYTRDGAYTGKGFLTALRLLDISESHLRRIVSPFSRDLAFPIMADKPDCTSLFTEQGRQKFAMDIEACRATYENAYCKDDTYSKLEMRRLDITEESIPCEYVLYEDENQILMDSRIMHRLRQNTNHHISQERL